MDEQHPQVQEWTPSTNEAQVSPEWYSQEYEASPPTLPELCEKAAIRTVAHIYLPVMAVLFCVLGVLGNGILLLIRARYHRVQSLSDVLLLHLAISDLLLLLTLPVGVAGVIDSWRLGTATCHALQGFHALTSYSGFLFLMGLTMDRYVVIVRAPIAHRLRPAATCWGRLGSGLVWLLSSALALPQFLYARVEDYQGFQLCRVAVVTTTVSLLQVIIGFALPFTVMVVCYTAIARTLLSSSCAQSHKALWLILALVLLFLALQLPYALLTLLDTADLMGHQASRCTVILRRDLALLITSGLAFARCYLNPVLHVFLGVRFRRDLQQLTRDAGCLGQGPCCGKRSRSGNWQASFTTHLEGTSGAP
ncbi:C-C chemokine receptor type 10 [Hemicordylus capensis]|uniref:C-C chemokine receptor type 10 n=1 Tax=Hemicordylus capensis TaxID=884348 RepID=UPI002304C353|nr:C-C chemokine receptor type 10 [Hemicordylus capensis]XP_053118986.1 C-C chemokine receptor type 10 [Hemicordylus capensis]